MQRVRPVVAEVEFPVRVEREMFASTLRSSTATEDGRHSGGGKWRDKQRGARAGNESANDWNDFRFQK
jgi:hypothetical protein